MKHQILRDCPDCGSAPGNIHKRGCDIERCSSCGGQRVACDCDGHDPAFSRWTGLWPGAAEACLLGLFTKWDNDNGWIECGISDPEASPSLNAFAEKGYCQIFFVKPEGDER